MESFEGEKESFLSQFSFIRGNFLLIIIGWLMVDFTREMAYTYYPLYVTALGGTATILGIINASGLLVEAFVKIPGGILADKYRRKKLIITMTLLASVSYLLFAIAPSWHFLLLGAMCTSFCWIYTPGFESIVVESLPEEKRGTGYSIINLITRVSTTPSPLIAGLLFTSYGVVGTTRIGFVLVSVAFLTSSILRRRLVEETDKPEVGVREVLDSLGNAKGFAEGIGVWKEVPRELTTLLSVELMYLLPNVMFNAVMILYIINDLGITEVQLSYLGPIIGVSMIMLSLPAGKIVDRYGSVKPLLVAYVLTFFAVPLLLDASFTQLVLATPIIGLLNVIFYTSTQALWAAIIPEDKRGRVMGSKSFFSLITVASGNILGGLIYDNISHTLPLYLFMAVCIPSFLLTLVYIIEPEKSEEIVDKPV
jgi:MFS family permease